MRKMQALGIVPSDSIAYFFGLFCSGNFFFDTQAENKAILACKEKEQRAEQHARANEIGDVRFAL